MPRVLVVEDDRELRHVVCYSLMDIGATCVEAVDGRQALEVLCRSIEPDEQFDLVLMDILMPGGVSGWDVLEAMRANPLWQAVPVIILSGKATLLAERERARKLNATHMQKTARFVDEVTARAREILGLDAQ